MSKVLEDMRNESFQEGIKQGIAEGMKATALRMLSAGNFSFMEIVKCGYPFYSANVITLFLAYNRRLYPAVGHPLKR